METISSLAGAQPIVAYATVFVLMIANGVSNLPSSQILYLFVGYLTTQGGLSIYMLSLYGGLGNALGNIILYELARHKGSNFIKKSLSKFFYISDAKQDHLKKLLERHGLVYIFLGKLIPGIKTFIPIVAGMTKISRSAVYLTLTVSSVLWAFIFLHIGALFGTNTQITKWYSIAATLVLLSAYIYARKKHPHLFKFDTVDAK